MLVRRAYRHSADDQNNQQNKNGGAQRERTAEHCDNRTTGYLRLIRALSLVGRIEHENRRDNSSFDDVGSGRLDDWRLSVTYREQTFGSFIDGDTFLCAHAVPVMG